MSEQVRESGTTYPEDGEGGGEESPYARGYVNADLPEMRDKYHREVLLENAMKIVAGDRDKQYNGPEESFTAIAQLWAVAFPERPWTPGDVALAQTLMKTARLITGGLQQEDTWTDVAGYAACGWEVSRSGDSRDQGEERSTRK